MELILGHDRLGAAITSDNNANPHIFADGVSGFGKSTLLRGLAEQAARQGACVIVLDYSGDFQDYEPPDNIAFSRQAVMTGSFDLNPLAASPELPPAVRAQRLVNILLSAYRLGNRACMALLEATETYLKQDPDPCTIKGLAEYVRSRPKSKGLEAALEPLELLGRLICCGAESVKLDLATPGIVVLDFQFVEADRIKRLVAELILRCVWDQQLALPVQQRVPLILILDECQHLGWGDGSMAVRILREGRKYQLGGWFASQWVEHPAARSALDQAALQFHFRPDARHVASLAHAICAGMPDKYKNCLTALQRLSIGEYVLCDAQRGVRFGKFL